MRWLVLTLLAACTFKTNEVSDAPGSNAGSDASPGAYCIGTFVKICRATPPPALFRLDAVKVLDTDTDPLCTVVHQQGGPDICALYYDEIQINNQLVARGARPLALAATTTITIGPGILELSSQRGQPAGAGAGTAMCAMSTLPSAAATTGGGGGAGGSFGSRGGDGGAGGITTASGGTSGAMIGAPTMLVGGCAGQAGGAGNGTAGAAGASGGGVYLVAGMSISVTNSVAASGAGGTGGGAESGGGGGGAGGLIVFEAPTVTVAPTNAHVIANGGGGAQGGDATTTGGNGGDGHLTDNGAANGGFGVGTGGNGGGGANGATNAGTGAGNVSAGGGGGGGVGYVLMIGHAPAMGGDYSPMYIVR